MLACMANVDLNPIRSGMVDSLDAADANVSIAERLRGLDGEPVDSASWLAPLELASEVDGQPVVVASVLFCPSAQLEPLVPEKTEKKSKTLSTSARNVALIGSECSDKRRPHFFRLLRPYLE